MQPWFTVYFFDIGHPCYDQLTPVKTRYHRGQVLFAILKVTDFTSTIYIFYQYSFIQNFGNHTREEYTGTSFISFAKVTACCY